MRRHLVELAYDSVGCYMCSLHGTPHEGECSRNSQFSPAVAETHATRALLKMIMAAARSAAGSNDIALLPMFVCTGM
jgi:hypothetical protein